MERYAVKIMQYAKQIDPDTQLVSFFNQSSLLFQVEEFPGYFDLLFLEMDLPGEDGIELAKRLRDIGYDRGIIFLTASTEDIFRAFDVGAQNYLVKNHTTDERFSAVVHTSIANALKNRANAIILSSGQEKRSISIPDIHYFRVSDHLVHVFYGNDQTFSFYNTISKLEERLLPYGFIRINRAVLSAISYIKSFNAKTVVLRDGIVCSVSRASYIKLRELF